MQELESVQELKKEDRASKILLGLRILFVVLFAAAITWGVVLYVGWVRADRQQLELAELHQTGNTAELAVRNSDYVGWLSVYGTNVDYPVVGGANEFYREHNYYGVRSAYGCIHIDGAGEDGHILVRGNLMKNGTMFGSLEDYLDVDFFTEHSVVCLELDGEPCYYELFALLVVPGEIDEEGYFPIEVYVGDPGEEATASLLTALESYAIYWRELDLDGSDQLLFLLTNDYTDDAGRLLLCGRLLG